MKFSHALLMGGVSAVALTSAAYAQAPADGQVEEVVVTGSRVIANGNQAPTPVTVVATEKLLEAAPANIGDAINRLPQFAAQTSVRGINNAGQNSSAQTISLRRFGANRTLILVDGSRVPPTSLNGSVDTNIIPQTLVQRVEIVTGGASAVYGSDAVTGVVNFIIDRNFNGLKFNSQYGISTYGDTQNWRVGGAAGMPIFGGRGHIEASFEHYDADGLQYFDSRPEGVGFPHVGGTGTAASPFRVFYHARTAGGAYGGLITGYSNPAGTATITPPVIAGLRDVTFKANGVPSPFVHGDTTITGISTLESGGDGTILQTASIASALMTNQAFARFDFDVTDTVHFHAQASYNAATNYFPYLSAGGFSAAIRTGNPFIPASIQQIMTANNLQYITVSKTAQRDDPYPLADIKTFSTNVMFKTGLEGRILDNWDWSVGYLYARSAAHTSNLNNRLRNRIAAAADAVVNPANGRIVCAVSLTPFAGLYPGCEPANPFGPTALSPTSSEWMTEESAFTLSNLMHDVNFSVTGSPFSIWAGPVTAAISGEYRFANIRTRSNADPTELADCTGLRVVGDNCIQGTTTAWASDTKGEQFAKQNVKEIAGELLIPLIRDVPFFQSFEVNLAGRLTDYSTSGRVETWKVGGAWQVNDDVRVRGTMSRDIRAPTLNDLFSPVTARPLGFSDLHTNRVQGMSQFTQGNKDLVPEVARTNTLGIVYQPTWAPRLSLALDYFEITINNAIANLSANTASVQRECEDSNGTSLLCTLFERPLPFSDHSAANFPTKTYSMVLNSAAAWTRGWDFEANYRLQLADVFADVPGDFAIRMIGTYQPVSKNKSTAGLPASESAGNAGFSKLRINLNTAYSNGGFNLAITNRWQSHQWFSNPRDNFDIRGKNGDGKIPQYVYTDVNISYRTEIGGHEITPYLTIENLFNTRPPLAGSGNAAIGLFFPSASGFDVIGRYFTIGVRGRL